MIYATLSHLHARGIISRGAGRQQPKRHVNLNGAKSYYRNHDEDGEVSLTADVVEDDPREPTIVPIGVLDARGEMLLRVTMPIKVPMGFHTSAPPCEVEAVQHIVPEDMLSASDCGLGQGYIDIMDIEAFDREHPDEPMETIAQPDEPRTMLMSDLIKQITGQGINIIDDLCDPEEESSDEPV